MVKRQNFSVSVKAEIKLRATRAGQTYCEAPGCGVLIKPGSGEVHHLDMDAMKTPDKKKKPLTAKDGAFWCEACHDPETKKQVAVLAKVKRQQAAHLGVKTPTKNPIKSRGFNDNALRANDNVKPEKPAPKVAEGESNLSRRYRAK